MHEQLTTESAQGLVFSPSSSFSSSSPEANKQGALYRLTKDIIRINRGQRKKEAVFEAGTVEEAAKQGLGGIRLENVVASLVHDYVKPNLKYGVDQNHNISKWLRKRGKPEKYELNELQLAQLKESFELMDTDGSGSIDESELRDCLKILGVNLTKSEIKAIFLEVDADGSGSIEYNEFLLLMTKAWEVSIGKGSTSSSMNDSFDNFQAASSSYRRTRLLNSILQSDVEQTQQMVEKFFGFKEKVLVHVSIAQQLFVARIKHEASLGMIFWAVAFSLSAGKAVISSLFRVVAVSLVV
uniref:Ef hand protein n=1 Tax=Tetraselmis sp. GSL018 TaxID=582737 RepID=A0A061RF83_9CHLO